MVSPQVLRRTSGFSSAGEESLQAVAKISQERRVPAGELLFKEGESATDLCFVIEGEVDLSFELRSGEVVVDTLVRGDLLCWSAIVAPYRTTATATARTDARLIAIPAAELRKLFESDGVLACSLTREVAGSLSRRLRGAHVQIAAAS